MGSWVIHIEGHGAHHNGNPAIDANEKAKEFVHELLGIGQDVKSATFALDGGRIDDVLPPKPLPEGVTTIDPKDVGKLFE